MAEKPVECSNCQKPCDITYKEMAQGKNNCIEMCSDCPILAKKIHSGALPTNKANASPKLCCALCMTTSETVQTGSSLGCNHCYTVFEEILLGKLLSENNLSTSISKEILINPSMSIHRGKLPTQALSIPLSNEVSSLNVALNDAIQKEHYEQAAWLRDQIKELKENASDGAK